MTIISEATAGLSHGRLKGPEKDGAAEDLEIINVIIQYKQCKHVYSINAWRILEKSDFDDKYPT